VKSTFCNDSINRKNIKSQKGFILLVAIIACAILAALGVLVISLSTGDLRTSVSTVGEKKALGAVESGYHILTQTFDPLATGYGISQNTWIYIDAANDPGSKYKITTVALSTFAPLPPPGYSMEASSGWGMARFDVTVVGENSSYNTNAQVDVGVGYGPVSLSLIYK
jgi:hypothetical protein